MATALHVAVRLLHVVAVALLFGGATLLWLRATRATGPATVVVPAGSPSTTSLSMSNYYNSLFYF